MLFLLYACLLRLNGYIPAAALVAVGAFLFINGSGSKKIVISVALALCLGVVVKGTSSLLNAVYKPYINHPLPTLMLWDIAGTYVRAGIPAQLPSFVTVTDKGKAQYWLKGYNKYSCSLCWNLGISCDNRGTKEDVELMKLWLKTIVEHPKAYLTHRASFSKVMLGFRSKIYAPYYGFSLNHRVGGAFTPSKAGDLIFVVLNKIFHLIEFIFQPFIWILVSLAVVFSRISRWRDLVDSEKVAIAVATSGILNAASLVFLAVSSDYRYVIWTVLAGLLSLFLVCLKQNYSRHL